MKQVVDFVDDAAIQRNLDWLLARRKQDGSGQFDMNPRQLDTFGGASQDITDAYIVWILSALDGFDYYNIGDELRNIEAIALKTNDPYLLALCSGALWNVGRVDAAKQIASRLSSF